MSKETDSDFSPARRHNRYKASIHVAVANHYTLLFETAVEISKGGMLLKTNSLPILHQILELRFFLPNKNLIFVKGEVAYRLKVGDQYYAGVRFIDANPELEDWLAAHAEKFSGKGVIS